MPTKKILFLLLLLPELALANMPEKVYIAGEYVYSGDEWVIIRQEAIITKDGFEFRNSKELDEVFELKEKRDAR